MKNLMVIFLLVLGVNLFAQNVPVDKRSRVFNADINSVQSAVIDYCNNKNFPIGFVNTELGILNTDYKLTGNGYRVKINFMLKNLETGKVLVTALITAEEKGYTGWYKAQVTGKGMIENYNKIFEFIGKKY